MKTLLVAGCSVVAGLLALILLNEWLEARYYRRDIDRQLRWLEEEDGVQPVDPWLVRRP